MNAEPQRDDGFDETIEWYLRPLWHRPMLMMATQLQNSATKRCGSDQCNASFDFGQLEMHVRKQNHQGSAHTQV